MPARPWNPGPETIPHRMPPCNVEAEACVLGSMLIDNATIDDVAGILKTDDFFRDTHGTLFRAIQEIHGRGSAVDGTILAEHLEASGEFVEVGGHEAIRSVLEAPPHSVNATYYAQIVRQKSVARSLIAGANDILRDGYSNLYSADELVERAETRVFSIGDAQATGDTSDVATAVEEATALIARRRGGEIVGVASGMIDIDDLLGGFQPGTLTVIGARPSMGKSAYALNIADHAAINCGVVPLIVSLEMGRTELALRMLQSRAEVDGYKLRRADLLTQAEHGRLLEASTILRHHSFPIDDSPIRSASQIAANARRLKARRNIGLVIVDYLQLVDGEGNSRQEQVASISRRLKQLAKELNLPVIALSQINRAVEGREDHRPRMADLRESGAIEQDADVVILLHRPEYYDPNDSPGVAEAIVAKNRNGGTDTIKLVFRRNIARFDSLSPIQEGP